MKIEFLIYIVTLPNGRYDYAVCGESDDNVFITVGDFYFDSNAYHLEDAAKEAGVGYKCMKVSLEV